MKRHLILVLLLALLTAAGGCARKDASQDVRSGTSSNELDRNSGREKTDTSRPEPPPEPSADADLTFIDTMTRHHQDELAVVRSAATNAARAELQEFAAEEIADRERQIALMKGWRDQWYAGHASAVSNSLPGMSRMSAGALEGLTGAAYDAKFLDMMIEHEKGGTTMAAASLEKVSHPELKALCQQIIDTGALEISKLTAWKGAAGGAAPPDTGGTR